MNTIVKKLGIMVAMLLSFLPALAYDFEVDSVYYDVVSLDEMTCEVVGADPNVADLKLHGVVKFKGREFTAQIKEEAFKASGIKSLWIGDGMEEIPSHAFESCENLTNVRLESVKVVGGYSFYNCSNLSEIELGVAEVIESRAFDKCAYETITIPGSVVDAEGLPLEYVWEVNFLWGEENLKLNTYLRNGCKIFLNRNIYGFSDCHCTEKDVTFGNEVTVFPANFGHNFKEIDLSQTNIRTIEKSAFSSTWDTINKVILPECLDSIKSYAFWNASFKEINLPASLKYLGEGIFKDCKKLKRISLPGSIKIVPEDCFWRCYELSEIVLGEGIEEIGKQAFRETAITNVTFPESLNTIGENAFRDSDLSSVYIPGNVSLIKADAFFDLKKLKKLELGESENPLQIIQGVLSKNTRGSSDTWYDTEDKAGQKIYSVNYSLISPLISDSITHLIVNRPVCYDYDVHDSVFDDIKTEEITQYQVRHRILNYSLGLPNSSLTSLYIGENCRDMFTEPQEIVDSYVKYDAYRQINFKDTYYLSPMLYPENLGNLKELTVQMMTPPELHADFPTSTYLSATLRVPVGAKAAYESAPYWKNFWEIVETEDLSGIDDIPESSCDKLPIEWYNVNGLRMNGDYENLPEGIYILRQGNKTKKVYKN